MESELSKAYWLGITLLARIIDRYCEDNFITLPTSLLISEATRLLEDIGSGEVTLLESPASGSSEQTYQCVNILTREYRELAKIIRDEMGPEI